jgi:2-polyprenyl-3-methyl-5-hydroxy-6-metoxy-1,4-benzoquinol methylase
MKGEYMDEFGTANHDFWKARVSNPLEGICTNDLQLDRLESDQIIKRLSENCSVLEAGCGAGVLARDIQSNLSLNRYHGFDFVQDLIEIAKSHFANSIYSFDCRDITKLAEDDFTPTFDFVVTKRVIQNIKPESAQLKTIDTLSHYLVPGGKLILVESSKIALSNINTQRAIYGLPMITPPWNNLFLDDNLLKSYHFKNLELMEIDSFATNYYFITRILYARLAQDFLREKTNYSHPLNEIALTTVGNLLIEDFSQIKTFIFEKRSS